MLKDIGGSSKKMDYKFQRRNVKGLSGAEKKRKHKASSLMNEMRVEI